MVQLVTMAWQYGSQFAIFPEILFTALNSKWRKLSHSLNKTKDVPTTQVTSPGVEDSDL